MAAEIKNVSDSTFEEEVLNAEIPVLVDFWAAWCAPCLMIAPTLEKISDEFESKVRVVKLNVDENMKTPVKYGIRGIPTLLLFKEGELKETIVGVQPREKIVKTLLKHI